jgi:hypothetical protein
MSAIRCGCWQWEDGAMLEVRATWRENCAASVRYDADVIGSVMRRITIPGWGPVRPIEPREGP